MESKEIVHSLIIFQFFCGRKCGSPHENALFLSLFLLGQTVPKPQTPAEK